MIRLAIVEDDAELRGMMQEYFEEQENFLCDLVFDSVEGLFNGIQDNNLPNIVLMDIELPGMSGIQGMKLMKEKYPEVDIVILTVYNDSHRIFDALCAGASGYLLKNSPFSEIKTSLETLYDGGSPMSPQIAKKVIEYFQPKVARQKESPLSAKEKEVVVALVDGLSYKQIADRMFISPETVRTHIKNIYKKLHVHTRAELVGKSLRDEI